MLAEIVTELKTLSVKNVVPFGTETMPATPYTVVRQERNPIHGGSLFRVTAHFRPDQILDMNNYTRREVYPTLNKFKATDSHGNYNMLKAEEWNAIQAVSDDGTISEELVFSAPGVPVIQY